MCAHWPVAFKRASGIAVTWIWERIIFHFIVPWLHQLQDGSVPKIFVTVKSVTEKTYSRVAQHGLDRQTGR